MYENNKKEKDEILNPEKIKNKKFNSSIISPKKVVTKNSIKIKKGVYQIQKRPKIIIEEDNYDKNNQENKTINNNKIFVNPKKQNINNNKTETNNSINISHSHNSKRIKINIINKTKNNRNK